ncbi:hypothetical protein HDU87_003907 [Geranomyces variabilis]|uniref:Uncharacterized protein n=1 Tax=Geranomyces variabilis TaxID=109894 RepID=A0AAD5TR94_9FUNG|nr:hypothetical protein HDU87_003907 [Geranomyces variabilis]
MPAFLRLHLTKAPPATVALAVPFAIAISVTDDLATTVYFGTDAIPLRISLVDATSYTPLEGLTISPTTAAAAKRRLEIPATGQGLLAVQVVITDKRPAARQPQHKHAAKFAARLVVEVDPAALVQLNYAGGKQSDEVVVGPELLGAKGVLRSDAGELLPWPVYSGVVTVSPVLADLQAETVQDCQRHFFLTIPSHSSDTGTRQNCSSSSSSSSPSSQQHPLSLLRIPVQEHARMTFSTGTHTWDCSPILAHVLACTHTRWLPTTTTQNTVIELGAGCGLVGTVAALLGADRVVMTDLDDPSKSALRENVAIAEALLGKLAVGVVGRKGQRGGRTASSSIIHARVLEWGKLSCETVDELLPRSTTSAGSSSSNHQAARPPHALIVAADVLYNVGSHDEFLSTLVSLTGSSNYDVDVLIGYKKRGRGEDRFFDIARDAGFKIETVAAAWGVEVFWLKQGSCVGMR